MRREGCDEVQGDWFSPAVPAQALTQLLQEIKDHGWQND